MLTTLFPKACHAHSSLPLLGSIADNFDDWLLDRGYKVTSRTNAIEMLHHIDSDLRRRGIKHITRLTHGILHRSWRALIPRFPTWACTVRVTHGSRRATTKDENGPRHLCFVFNAIGSYFHRSVGAVSKDARLAG